MEDHSAQEVLQCDLCKTAPLQSHCALCQKNFCENCIGKHLSDSSKQHIVVPYSDVKYTPKCPKHDHHYSTLFCENCHIHICSVCVESGNHIGHKLRDILRRTAELDLKELENSILPRFEQIASELKTRKVNLKTNYEKKTDAVIEHGELWHQQINDIVENLKCDIQEMKTKHMDTINQQDDEITSKISELKKLILHLKNLLNTNDASAYKSKIDDFRRLPDTITVSFPCFSPGKIITERIHKMFGCLTASSLTSEERGYTFLYEPQVIATIDTGYRGLRSVACLSDDEIWIRGNENIMRLCNIQGKLLKSVETKSGNVPTDIAMTRDGDLVYTDDATKTVNIVKNTQIQEVIKLEGWEPFKVRVTFNGDMLVTMDRIGWRQSKIVRYSLPKGSSGFKEKQTIQFDDQGESLYSSGYPKYICENRNLDICVADVEAKAVVVVSQSGKLRFRYNGHPSNAKEQFDPHGITTDSHSHILTADCNNNRIHILDRDGQFLRFIDNCGLQRPYGLCVETSDNVFVVELQSRTLKKIQYL